MSHRFSNPKRVRDEILAMPGIPASAFAPILAEKYSRWEDIPHEIRLMLLEYIQILVEEVIREVQS